jgi:HupE / UreJ protein
VLGQVPRARAHEVRPAVLQIEEIAPGRYNVLWRTPLLSGSPLPVVLQFPDDVRAVTDPAVQELPDSIIERRVIEPAGGTLAGRRVHFIGLQATITDVMVRVRTLDGRAITTLVRPSQPWLDVAHRQAWGAVAGTYLRLGIEHIWGGIDHLLFLLALLLLVPGWRRVVATITAFTVAHSLTLAAATLGFVHVPQKPVEATIALSRIRGGGNRPRTAGQTGIDGALAVVIAFAFGLLHGFGFASALNQVGLPQNAIPVALLFFNLGVEAGQLLFIAAVLVVVGFARKALDIRHSRFNTRFPWVWRLPPYTIGSVAAFWLIQRIVAFGA